MGSADCQVSDCECGQLEHEDRDRCGQAFFGGKDIDLHGDPWTRCGGTSGGDEGREGLCLFGELRDGVSSLTVDEAGQRGGSSSVGKSGQIRIVESRAEVEGQGGGGGSRKKMTNIVSAV